MDVLVIQIVISSNSLTVRVLNMVCAFSSRVGKIYYRCDSVFILSKGGGGY